MKVYVLMCEVFYQWAVDSIYSSKESAILEIAKRKENNTLVNFVIHEYELHE